MRIRTVKPEFWQSESLGLLPREVRMLAAALLNLADDEGYFKSHSAVIAGQLMPYDPDGQVFVASALPRLATVGFVQLFSGGIGLITNFRAHQRINRPSASQLKAKAGQPLVTTEFSEDSVSAHGGLSEDSLPEGKGREGKGKGSVRGRGASESDPTDPAPSPREASEQEKLFEGMELLRAHRCSEVGVAPGQNNKLKPARINDLLLKAVEHCGFVDKITGAGPLTRWMQLDDLHELYLHRDFGREKDPPWPIELFCSPRVLDVLMKARTEADQKAAAQ